MEGVVKGPVMGRQWWGVVMGRYQWPGLKAGCDGQRDRLTVTAREWARQCGSGEAGGAWAWRGDWWAGQWRNQRPGLPLPQPSTSPRDCLLPAPSPSATLLPHTMPPTQKALGVSVNGIGWPRLPPFPTKKKERKFGRDDGHGLIVTMDDRR